MKLFNLLAFLCITGVSGCKYQAPSPSEFRVFQEVSSLEEFHSLAKRQGLSSPTLLIYRGELRSVLEQYHFDSLGVKYSFFTLNAETADGQTLIRTLPIKLIPALVNYKEKTAVSVTYYAQEGKAAATMQLFELYQKGDHDLSTVHYLLKHRDDIRTNIPNWLSIHNQLLARLSEGKLGFWKNKEGLTTIVDYVDNVGLDIAQELLINASVFRQEWAKLGIGIYWEADWQLSQLAVRSVSLAALTKNQELFDATNQYWAQLPATSQNQYALKYESNVLAFYEAQGDSSTLALYALIFFRQRPDEYRYYQSEARLVRLAQVVFSQISSTQADLESALGWMYRPVFGVNSQPNYWFVYLDMLKKLNKIDKIDEVNQKIDRHRKSFERFVSFFSAIDLPYNVPTNAPKKSSGDIEATEFDYFIQNMQRGGSLFQSRPWVSPLGVLGRTSSEIILLGWVQYYENTLLGIQYTRSQPVRVRFSLQGQFLDAQIEKRTQITIP